MSVHSAARARCLHRISVAVDKAGERLLQQCQQLHPAVIAAGHMDVHATSSSSCFCVPCSRKACLWCATSYSRHRWLQPSVATRIACCAG